MMRQTLLRNLSICARNLLSSPTSNINPKSSMPRSLVSLSSISFANSTSFFASKTDSSIENYEHPLTDSVDRRDEIRSGKPDDLEDDVSNEELRRQIETYYKGDGEAIPLIFEAILKRKLSGKHDESDDELMNEFRHNPLNDLNDEETGSDSDEEFDSDLDD